MNGKNLTVPELVFDHIGIVASNVSQACASFGAAIGAVGVTQRFDDAGLGVSVQFLRDRAGVVYEMIAPLGDNSPVAKSLMAKTNLLNQIAYTTTSIDGSMSAMRQARYFPLGAAKPALAFGNARVQFLFCPLGFVIELIEAPGHQHKFMEFTA